MSYLCQHGNRKHLGILLLISCLSLPWPAHSQNTTSRGQIAGTVSAPNHAPVVGAQVTLSSNTSAATPKQTKTDKTGHYSFTGLLRGVYKVSAGAPGFKNSEPKIVILASASATADLTLTPLATGRGVSKSAGMSPQPSPSFRPAGMSGTTAPSGYSSGLSAEESARVLASADAMGTALFNPAAQGAQTDCNQEPVLLRNLQKSPHAFAPNHTLGVFYLSHGNYSKAMQYLSAAHTIAPGDFKNTRDLAIAMIGDGRGSDAVALLKQMLPYHESDAPLFRLLAFAYRSAGENAQAIAAFRSAAAMDAGTENQYECGVGLIQLGASRQALTLFAAATKAHPESARLWLGLGIAERLLDHGHEAISALLRSADADPDFLPPLTLLADLSGLSDQTNDGLRRRIAAYLVSHPGDAEAHLAYARVLSRQSESNEDGNSRQEIISQLHRALQLNPGLAQAHFLLGDTEAEANNLHAAIAQFVEGLKLEPANARAHYRLSLLYRRNGQPKAARKELNAFLALRGKPDDKNPADTAGSFSPVTPSIPRDCDNVSSAEP